MEKAARGSPEREEPKFRRWRRRGGARHSQPFPLSDLAPTHARSGDIDHRRHLRPPEHRDVARLRQLNLPGYEPAPDEPRPGPQPRHTRDDPRLVRRQPGPRRREDPDAAGPDGLVRGLRDLLEHRRGYTTRRWEQMPRTGGEDEGIGQGEREEQAVLRLQRRRQNPLRRLRRILARRKRRRIGGDPLGRGVADAGSRGGDMPESLIAAVTAKNHLVLEVREFIGDEKCSISVEIDPFLQSGYG